MIHTAGAGAWNVKSVLDWVLPTIAVSVVAYLY